MLLQQSQRRAAPVLRACNDLMQSKGGFEKYDVPQIQGMKVD